MNKGTVQINRMQIDNSIVPSAAIVIAFVLQFGWAWVVRKGQTEYARDLYHFRSPTKIVSRYYSWRISRFFIAVLETVLINSITLGIIIFFGVVILGPFVIRQMLWIILLMVGFSVITSTQILLRLYQSNEIEADIVEKIGKSVDKIGEAKKIVYHYIKKDKFTDVSTWFALYRTAQSQDKVGWAIRDILLEIKNKDIEKIRAAAGLDHTTEKIRGPQIEAVELIVYM